MDQTKLRDLAELLEAYHVELITDGTMITHVNGHEAQLDATKYMPDQLIDVILKIIGADLRQALFQKSH